MDLKSTTGNSSDIRNQIKRLQERADLIELAELISVADVFLNDEFLKCYKEKPEIINKIQEVIRDFLVKYANSIKNDSDITSLLEFDKDEILILKMLCKRVSSGTKIDLTNNKILTKTQAADEKRQTPHTNTSNNEQVKPARTGILLDPTSCLDVRGSRQKLLSGADIIILYEEAETYRARLLEENIEFTIYKDCVELT